MKRICWAFSTTLFIFVLGYSTACLAQTQAQAHANYYSWHQEPSANYYCSNVSCQDQTLGFNEECVVDRLSCPGGYKIVQSNIMGYKTRNNINDSKIAINHEVWNNGGLLDQAQWRLPSINAVNPAGIGFPLESGKTDRFRVFVPPGVSYLSLSLFCPRDDYLAVAVRWKQPPCENCMSVGSDADYESFRFDRENEYTLSALEERDIYLQNAGGHITVYSGGPGITVDEGGWLYVYTFFSRSRYINSSSYFARIEYTVRANVGAYRQFYNTTQWGAFGDPPEKPAYNNHYQEELSLHIERFDPVYGKWVATAPNEPLPENEDIKFIVKSKIDSAESVRDSADVYVAYWIDNKVDEYCYFLTRDIHEQKLRLLKPDAYGDPGELAFERDLNLENLANNAADGQTEYNVFSSIVPSHVFGTSGVSWSFLAGLTRAGTFFEDGNAISNIPVRSFKTRFRFAHPSTWDEIDVKRYVPPLKYNVNPDQDQDLPFCR